MNLLIHGYRLVLTCCACPEQYDVHDDEGKQVAYIRLRRGVCSVQCPDYGGEVVYTAEPKGDGIFHDDERMKYLYAAILAVQEWQIRERYKPTKEDDES
jgi:hypothetical protein